MVFLGMTQLKVSVKLVEEFSTELLEHKNLGLYYSFLNLTSLSSLISDHYRFNKINYFCDGWSSSLLMSLVSFRHFKRVSFDFTSIANDIFNYAEEKKHRVFLVGATDTEVALFADKIQDRYPDLILSGVHHGYFDKIGDSTISHHIIEQRTDFVLISMGAGRQEELMISLHDSGYEGFAFTCGGFFRQEAMTEDDYYPFLIDKFHLRAIYRMYNEPHTIKRYLLGYPLNFLRIIFWSITKKIKIQ